MPHGPGFLFGLIIECKQLSGSATKNFSSSFTGLLDRTHSSRDAEILDLHPIV